MITSLIIKAEISPGTHIDKAYASMQALADLTNCRIESMFNGGEISAWPKNGRLPARKDEAQ